MVPASESSYVQDELNHIARWLGDNNLQLKNTKSQEIVFVARNQLPIQPDPMKDIIRVDLFKLLDVRINNRTTAADHVTEVVQACSLYALRILHSQ